MIILNKEKVEPLYPYNIWPSIFQDLYPAVSKVFNKVESNTRSSEGLRVVYSMVVQVSSNIYRNYIIQDDTLSFLEI